MAKDDTRTSVTMPPGIYARIRTIADEERRKIAPQIVTLLEEALRAREQKQVRK